LIPDEKDREHEAEIELRFLKPEIEHIADRMKLNWPKIVLGSFFAVPAAIISAIAPGPAMIASTLGLVAAIYNAYEPFQQRNEALKKPVAYAALVQKQFR